jgi:hypothetical protein
MFHPLSLAIPIIVLAPNLLFLVLKPHHLPDGNSIKENPILLSLEWIGRIGVFILPVFSSIHMKNSCEITAFAGMLASIALYYWGWLRYFIHNRQYRLLVSPIMGIPVPMAIGPIVYFIFAAVVLHSIYLFVGSVLLAAGHIPLSLNSYYRNQQSDAPK